LYNSRLNDRGRSAPISSEQGLPGVSMDTAEDGYILSIGDLLHIIKKRLWVILLVALVLTGAAVGFSLSQTPMYQASAKILVGQERVDAQAPREDIFNLQKLTGTITEGIESRPVAEAVIQRLGLEMTSGNLLAHLDAEQISDTQFIQVSYRDPSPEMAQQVADTVGDVFSERVSEVSPSASAITATVWERAETPDVPVSPNPVRSGLVMLALGLILGTGLALILEYLDESWRSPEEAEQISGVPTFGVIPEFESLKGKKREGY
jgi:capsular polysaccharide biosynthesis protein